MTDTFRDLFTATQSSLREAPEQALATFEVSSRQTAGLHSEVSVRQFTLDVDEPPELGGSDRAPNPVEYVLAALATCQEITYRLYADALGIPLEGVSVKISGTLDLRGFFAADDSVRPGYRDIAATVTLDSPAEAAELRRLKAAVDRHCPVLDVLRHVTPVSIGLEIAGQGAISDAA
jgi:uncharacterized OsmC-like protein